MTLKWKRANKTETTNEGNRATWLVYRTDTDADGFWLVKRTFGWKNFMPENFLEINRYFALTSYCNTIVQSNNAFSMLGFSLAGKRRVHVLIFSSIGSWNRWRTLTETIFQGHTKIALLHFRRRRRQTFASLWGACLCFASLWRANWCGNSCVLGVHLSKICWEGWRMVFASIREHAEHCDFLRARAGIKNLLCEQRAV